MGTRVEQSAGTRVIAFGVDTMLKPGETHTFVQVWDTSEERQPCNEGPEGFNNMLVSEWDISEERVVEPARQYGIPVKNIEIWEAFD